MTNTNEKIKEIISKNDVVLFMKGTPEMPQCGFSMTVVNILKELKIKFIGVDVLADPEIRQGIKDFSNWPTVPQLYVKGEFIGGCDIAKEMYEKGELQNILK
jgi:monothiol glutaredoxin